MVLLESVGPEASIDLMLSIVHCHIFSQQIQKLLYDRVVTAREPRATWFLARMKETARKMRL